jgi:hypothetical protein
VEGKRVAADALLTGEVQLSAARRAMTVIIRCLDRKSLAAKDLARFTARLGVEVLVQSGASFLLRDDGDEAGALGAADQVDEGLQPHPLSPKAKPLVRLDVCYGGTPVPLEDRGKGQMRVPEPQVGQKVTFVLRRTREAGAGRLGVVLKVNGESTLYRQREPELQCTKWILRPDDTRVEIEGFQVDGKTALAFKVLSREESKGEEVNYGPDLGTISLVVYRESKGPPGKTESEEEGVISRGAYPKKLPRSRTALWEQLEELAQEKRDRGAVVPGDKVDSSVTEVSFVADPTPVQQATIIYYRPS